jgi:hypothetical protein
MEIRQNYRKAENSQPGQKNALLKTLQPRIRRGARQTEMYLKGM